MFFETKRKGRSRAPIFLNMHGPSHCMCPFFKRLIKIISPWVRSLQQSPKAALPRASFSKVFRVCGGVFLKEAALQETKNLCEGSFWGLVFLLFQRWRQCPLTTKRARNQKGYLLKKKARMAVSCKKTPTHTGAS